MSRVNNEAGTQDATAALRASGFRVTPQRLAIHETLLDLDRHVSAEEVLGAVSDRLPNVSLPTVYSALEALEEAGLVRRVAAGRGAALYDSRPADHHHMVCRRCGSVEDVEANVEMGSVLGVAAERGFSPDDAELVVHGLCARCRESGRA